MYAAPDQIGNHLVLCYNRKFVPKAPETGEEFLRIAKATTHMAKDPANTRYGFVMNLTEPYWLIPFFTGASAEWTGPNEVRVVGEGLSSHEVDESITDPYAVTRPVPLSTFTVTRAL